MSANLVPLAEWISETYAVKVLNIRHEGVKKGVVQLQIIFEFEADARTFRDQYGYDKARQAAIAEKFIDLEKERARKSGFWTRLLRPAPRSVWIHFSAFDHIAMADANEKISEADIDSLKRQVNDPRLWTVSRFFEYTTIFVYTDEQVAEVKTDGSLARWSMLYLDLLKPYDPFGYFDDTSFSLQVNSKHVFDTTYESNWFYYYR